MSLVTAMMMMMKFLVCCAETFEWFDEKTKRPWAIRRGQSVKVFVVLRDRDVGDIHFETECASRTGHSVNVHSKGVVNEWLEASHRLMNSIYHIKWLC